MNAPDFPWHVCFILGTDRLRTVPVTAPTALAAITQAAQALTAKEQAQCTGLTARRVEEEEGT